MKRYDLNHVDSMSEFEDGDYVRYDEAAARIAELEADRDAYSRTIRRQAEDYAATLDELRTELAAARAERESLREYGMKRDSELADGQRELAAVKVDAVRYQHIQQHGFPVRNQTGDIDTRWVAFTGQLTFFGATPSFAIDAAMAHVPQLAAEKGAQR